MSADDERGFSLIEMLVATLLAGFLAWLGSSFFTKQQKLTASQDARDEAVKTNKYLANILRRDLLFALAPEDVVVNSLHDITIKRPKRQLSGSKPDPTQIYEVRYRAVCAKVPPDLTTTLGKASFTTVSNNAQTRSSCLKTATLKCSAGTFPQLQIVFPKAPDIPSYSASLFPDLSATGSRINRGIAGVLPCFQQNGSQITVGLDTFNLKHDGSQAQSLDLVAERLFLLVGNVSDMVILQQ